MIEFTSTDLVFLSKLNINIVATAIEHFDENKGKPYWVLHISAENQDYTKDGILHGARGDIRKFYQLNSVIEACKKFMSNLKEIKVVIN
jgi:hypothetical protein